MEIDVCRAATEAVRLDGIGREINARVDTGTAGKGLKPQAVVVASDHWIGRRQYLGKHCRRNVEPRPDHLHQRLEESRRQPRLRDAALKEIRVLRFPSKSR